MTEVGVDSWGPQRPQGGGRTLANLGWLAMAGLVYALGTTIPLYGIDPQVAFTTMRSVGIDAGMRLSIFGLGLAPLFMPLAFLELAKLFVPRLARWQLASAANMFGLNDCVRLVAFALAALQGYGIARAMQQIPDMVPQPGVGFIVATMSSYVASTALLSWLADRISLRGFGNGFWLLWIVPFVNVLPRQVLQLLELAKAGAMAPGFLPVALGLVLICGVVIVLVNLATVDRLLPRDGHAPAPSLAWLMRLTTQALIWPPLLANIVIGIVVTPIYLSLSDGRMATWLQYGSGGHILLFGALTLFFAHAYARGASNWRPDLAGAFGEESEPRGLPAPFWLFGLMQVAVCTSWELLASLAAPMDFFTGSSLIVVVTVMTIFTRPWRRRLS